MPWDLILTVLSFLLKFVFQKKEGRKMSDKEFMESFNAYQVKMDRVSKQSSEYDANYEEAARKLEDESN